MIRRVDTGREIPGSVYLRSMPAQDELLDDFLAEAEQHGIRAVLALTPDPEMAPEYLEAIHAGTLPFEVIRFPIPDGGVPSDIAAFRRIMAGLAVRLRLGENILIHCLSGVGRTALAAICLFQEFGISQQNASYMIGKAGSYPESPDQLQFLRTYR